MHHPPTHHFVHNVAALADSSVSNALAALIAGWRGNKKAIIHIKSKFTRKRLQYENFKNVFATTAWYSLHNLNHLKTKVATYGTLGSKGTFPDVDLRPHRVTRHTWKQMVEGVLKVFYLADCNHLSA